MNLLTSDQLPADFLSSVRARVRADEQEAAWRQARLGKITASCFGKVKPGTETARTYLFELLAEHLAGEPFDNFGGSRATEWGNENEPHALELYGKQQPGLQPGRFFQAEGFQLVGGTPDGLVGDEGCVEVKCPYTPKNHIRTLVSGEVPDEYRDQVDGHLLTTGREWCDFVSFDPRMPEPHHFKIVRVPRDESKLAALRDRLARFEAELLDALNLLA